MEKFILYRVSYGKKTTPPSKREYRCPQLNTTAVGALKEFRKYIEDDLKINTYLITTIDDITNEAGIIEIENKRIIRHSTSRARLL